MGSCRSFFSWIVVEVILRRNVVGWALKGCPPENEVILILPPVQFGNPDTACHRMRCKRGYCSRKELAYASGKIRAFYPLRTKVPLAFSTLGLNQLGNLLLLS